MTEADQVRAFEDRRWSEKDQTPVWRHHAALELVRNEMTRFLGQRKPADFSFIGVVEKLDASMARFFQRFNLPPVSIPNENANPERRSTSYGISEAERSQILELNQEDWTLYQTCLSRHEDEAKI